MNMGGSAELSYVDTERETITAEIAINGNSGGNQLETVNQVEPLEEDGGLDRNEVAELHAIKITAMPSFERTGAVADEPLVPFDFSGVTYFGANLDLSEQPRPLDEGSTVSASEGITNGQPNPATALFSCNEVGIFDYIRYFASRNYLDSQGGDGSGPYAAGSSIEVDGAGRLCYPVDYGIRGPVIDENDDLSFISRIVVENRNNSDVSSDFELAVTTDLVYRIHEIENVRNDFSLPR